MAREHNAGVFDIRNIIGSLLLIYGVILLVTRLVSGDEGGEATDGVNANLYAGLALVVIGVGFIAWSRIRPVKVPEHTASPEDLPPPKH